MLITHADEDITDRSTESDRGTSVPEEEKDLRKDQEGVCVGGGGGIKRSIWF